LLTEVKFKNVYGKRSLVYFEALFKGHTCVNNSVIDLALQVK